MTKNHTSIISGVLVAAIIWWIFYSAMPRAVAVPPSPTAFSATRALETVAAMAQAPHYTGADQHNRVAAYLEAQLHALGLETSIQEGYVFSNWGTLVKARNILARIKGTGNGKALMLLSHYDSAPHSSLGAGDDATGIAVILEGLRAFMAAKKPHANDLVILFSDAEELGLNGAVLFVTQHQWAKDIGLVLNFEARGTGGPSYMLMETNHGNAAMLNAFIAAHPQYPVSNSLMYSIYKMLPNDTDLTVFREAGTIQGFNFAFIDNVLNYHTAQDDLAHLSPLTVQHQGTYLMPLLDYFSGASLAGLDVPGDEVYFNTPLYFVHYPFAWNLLLVALCFLLLVMVAAAGFRRKKFSVKDAAMGALPYFAALLLSCAFAFWGWKALQLLYPQYNDFLQGFTYNGHAYIGFFVFLSASVCFLLYSMAGPPVKTMSYSLVPVFAWILINLGLALYLPGAGFLIIPAFCTLLMLAVYVFTGSASGVLNLVLAIPALVVLQPFIIQLPIGLGMKLLFGSAALTVLLFTLLLPVFSGFANKRGWAGLMALIAAGCFIHAHMHAGYEKGQAKQNSLVYMYDADLQQAHWATYDMRVDDWTGKYLGAHPADAQSLKRYDARFRYTADAPVKPLREPAIRFLLDSVAGSRRHVRVVITPNRNVNRYDILAGDNVLFTGLEANGVPVPDRKDPSRKRGGNKVLSYHVVANEPLELRFTTAGDTDPGLELYESSYDLLSNPVFGITARSSWMIPTPFVLNDAVVIRKSIRPSVPIR